MGLRTQGVGETEKGRARRPSGPRRKRSKAASAEDEIHSQIVQAVMEHRLPPGAKLDEDGLAAIFGVSRTRLRKVISLLANEQIVTQRLNHGAYISRPSVKEAKEIFEARRGVEEIAIQIVCAREPPVDLSPLRAFVHHESQAYDAERKDTNRLSGDFHVVLAGLTGNSIIAAFVEQLVVRTSLVQAVYGPPSICLVHEHEAIVNALAAREVERVVALMKQHFKSIQDACDLREKSSDVVDLAAIFPQAASARGRRG